MTARQRLLAPILLALFTGCDAGPEDATIPQPDLQAGKGDATEALSRDEALRFGDEATGEFTRDLEFHGYRFRVGAGASFNAEVTQAGSSRGLNTTMFLFGPRQQNGAYPPDAIEFDDDSGWGDLSRLRDLSVDEDGEYLLVLGTHYGEGDRGRYRFVLECNDDSCEPDSPPVDLTVCADEVLDYAHECIAEYTWDTQDPQYAIAQCTEAGYFADIYDSLCHVGALATPHPMCQYGLEAYNEHMVPACQAELRGDLPQSDLDLSGRLVNEELALLLEQLQEQCDEHCDVEIDAWTYQGDDPTLAEAAEAVRASIDGGVNYSDGGSLTPDGAASHIDGFTDFAAAADRFSESSTPQIGLLRASSVPFANVDAFTSRVFLVYPDTNTIVSIEETEYYG
jgi:hypothetical protein